MPITDQDAITDQIAEIIEDLIGIERDQVLIDSHLVEDLGFDSLDNVSFIMALESEFDIDISDDEFDTIQTVDDCVNLVASKEAEK